MGIKTQTKQVFGVNLFLKKYYTHFTAEKKIIISFLKISPILPLCDQLVITAIHSIKQNCYMIILNYITYKVNKLKYKVAFSTNLCLNS